MKPSRSLTVYIATSAGRNLHAYFLLRERLWEKGHKVLDWTTLPEFPLAPDIPVDKRRACYAKDSFGEVFAFCSQAVNHADLVIYLGLAGQDAAVEVGMAHAVGTPVYGLRGLFEAPGTMLFFAVQQWFSEPGALLAAVERFAEETPEAGAA